MLDVDVEKRLGDFSLSARFQSGNGVTAVFGPSGAGKTTLVNMIAGLVAPDRGRIAIDAAVLFDSAQGVDLPPHRRRIGYVFQEGRLFPHLSVAHNLDYGRRMCGLPPDRAQMARIVGLLDIGQLMERRPGKLSGGERQRDEVGVPMVYVSHQAAELRRIATTVVRLKAGKVAAAGGKELLDAADTYAVL
jgi:molybdate transport system ATP-binding protein